MRTVVHKITPMEYRRRVFNATLTECLCRLQEEVLNPDGDMEPHELRQLRAFSEAFYKDALDLNGKTIQQTRQLLSEADQFVQDAMDTAEQIADDKKDAVERNKMYVTDDQDVEFSEEDNAIMDQLFDLKKPTPAIDQIRDATVAALVVEDQKSKEIKDAIDIAKSQVDAGADPKVMEEAVSRINAIGPTSLMNGLLNYFSSQAIKQINESGTFTSINEAMADNRDIIKDRATMVYSLYEASSVLGICKYDRNQIEKLAHDFYYGK
ncbi:MAG: hypothetical protein K2F99_04925 [Muribaculaceae bacterium]|nr:hypothetical protein [Muribaculaceae bacterium]